MDSSVPSPAHECKCHCLPLACDVCEEKKVPETSTAVPVPEPNAAESDFSANMHIVLFGIIGLLLLVVVILIIGFVWQKFRADLSDSQRAGVERERDRIGRELAVKTARLARAEDQLARFSRLLIPASVSSSNGPPPPPADGSMVQNQGGQVRLDMGDLERRRVLFASSRGGGSVWPADTVTFASASVLEDVQAARDLADELAGEKEKE
jgi:hypothetical protein